MNDRTSVLRRIRPWHLADLFAVILLFTGLSAPPLLDPDGSRYPEVAREMLERGDSLVVLPEGSRTLDGSVGRFYPGAFKLAIKAGVPVVPMAIKGGRAVSRRGEWKIRPGRMEVAFAAPVSTDGLEPRDANALGSRCREIVIDLLQGRRRPGDRYPLAGGGYLRHGPGHGRLARIPGPDAQHPGLHHHAR